MTTKKPPARTAGRRRPSMLTVKTDTVAQEIDDFIGAAMAAKPEEPPIVPRRDPAEVVAEIMLAAALSTPPVTLSMVSAPGAVVAVRVPEAGWLEPTKGAWTRLVSGELSTRDADGFGSVRGSRPMAYAFTAEQQPTGRDRETRSETLFADVIGHGHSAVGFSPEMAWLPADLERDRLRLT